MPLYDYVCLNDHRLLDRFAFSPGVQTIICHCGETMMPVGFGFGQTWFRENSPRVIRNLGPEPVSITSAEQHKAEMKKAGVEWSTGWDKRKSKGWV